MNFLISKEDLQKLADYLAVRPWGEANPYIAILAKLQPVQEAASSPAPAAAEEANPTTAS